MLRLWQLCSLDLYYCMLVSRMSLKEGFINNVLWRHTLHFDVWQKGILPHIRYLFHISRIINTQQDIRILLLLCRSLCNITEWCEFGSLGKNIHCRVKQRTLRTRVPHPAGVNYQHTPCRYVASSSPSLPAVVLPFNNPVDKYNEHVKVFFPVPLFRKWVQF